MKSGIHPKYEQVQVTCSCGSSFTTGTTLCRDIRLEVCSECHPFYTGQQKIVDTAGRVDRFKQRYGVIQGNKTPSEDQEQSDQG